MYAVAYGKNEVVTELLSLGADNSIQSSVSLYFSHYYYHCL